DIAHSAYLGGIVAGWFYAHLLGFGRASILQRALRQRRSEVDRYRAMTLDQFISEEVDPILDKISREGLKSLTWNERRILARAQEKIAEKEQARKCPVLFLHRLFYNARSTVRFL